MALNAADDPRELERECFLCGKFTQSHRVPNGWCCHECWLEAGEVGVLLDLDVDVSAHVEPNERIDAPAWVGGAFKLSRSPEVKVVRNAYEFSEFAHAVYCQHPQTTIPVEIPVGETALEVLHDAEEIDFEEMDELP